MIATILLAALTIPTEPSDHPYDLALEYCRDKGGLAIYAPRGEVVKFSCGDDVSKVITISR